MVQLNVKFEKPPKLKIQEFLTVTLKFVQLNENSDNLDDMEMTANDFRFNNTERMDVDATRNENSKYFFYCHENYFKGMLVRLKTIDLLNVNMKVYLR
jgi:hypothetical protein